MEFLGDHPVLLSAAVFFARVLDVSLGTLRTILVFRAYRTGAALIGFVEILIWIAAAGVVLRDLSAWYVAVAYAGGFAAGNYVGIWGEAKLAMGTVLVRAISASPEIALANRLREDDYSVTVIDARDDDRTPVEILLVTEERRRLPHLLQSIEQNDPNAIYTISDVKTHRSTEARFRERRMLSKRK